MNRVHCKYHPSAILVHDYSAGDLVCPICGLVVGDRVIDPSSEWRSFANDGNGEDHSRVGKVEDTISSETYTSITIRQSYDARHLDENGNQKYKNRQVISPVDRMLKECRGYINAIGERLHINSNMMNTAMTLVKRLTEKPGFTKKRKQDIACACIFIVCRNERLDRSFKEISSVSDCAVKSISKMFKLICANLEIESKAFDLSEQMSRRFCQYLGLKNNTIPKLAFVIAMGSKKFIDSKKPATILATSIYMASHILDEPISKSKIKDVIDVTETTVLATYRIFYTNRAQLIPSEYSEFMTRLPYN